MTGDTESYSPRERHIIEVLGSNIPTVAFVQYGPDGTTPVNAVRFYSCPLCGVPIPIPMDERPDLDFPQWHIDHHLQIARMEDRIDALTEMVRSLEDDVDGDWVGSHMATTYAEAKDRRPHSRACGWQPHEHGTACHSNCPTCGGRDLKRTTDG